MCVRFEECVRLEGLASEVSLKARVAWIELGRSEVMDVDTTEDWLLAQAVSAPGHERVESGLEV